MPGELGLGSGQVEQATLLTRQLQLLKEFEIFSLYSVKKFQINTLHHKIVTFMDVKRCKEYRMHYMGTCINI